MSGADFDLWTRSLYLCTPIRADMANFASAVLTGGVDMLQLREKNADARTIIRHAIELRKITRDFGVPFFINDRPDIALEVEADGVHVGQDDVSVDLVRKILPNAIVGLSTHSEGELHDSLAADVDYISAGPIVATPTKPGRAGTGIDYPRLAVQRSQHPVFVTGGVIPSSISPLVKMGITHFVVVRYLTEASDPLGAARELKRAIDASLGNADKKTN